MILSAAKWYAISHVVKHLVIWVTLLLYTRYLLPDQYGLLIILSIVNGVILLLKDFGLGSALIHSEQDDDFFYSSLYWLNLFISFACFLALFLSSDLIALLFKNDTLIAPIEVISVGFLFLGVSGLKISSFEKKFRFKTVAALELISVMLASVTGIYFANEGYQIWAYVMQVTMQSMLFMLMLFIFSDRRLYLYFSWGIIKKARSFSRNLVGYSILNYAMKNLDTIIIGSLLGEVALGVYSLAFKLVVYPVQTVSIISQRVLFPIFSRVSDEAKFNGMYMRFMLLLVVLLFPMYGIFYLVAPAVIPVAFGEEWGDAIYLLNFLIPIGLMQIFVSPVGIIYQAKGRTDLLFKWGLVSGLSTLCALLLGIKWGVTGVSIGLLVITMILFVPALMIPFSLINFKLTDLLISLRKTIAVASFVFVGVFFLGKSLIISNAFFSVLLLSILFLVAYVSLMWVFERKMFNEILIMMGVLK